MIKLPKRSSFFPIILFFIEYTSLIVAILYCLKENKNYQLPDNHIHLSTFSSGLNYIAFSTRWFYDRFYQFDIVKPITQQELWSEDLNIQSVNDWEKI